MKIHSFTGENDDLITLLNHHPSGNISYKQEIFKKPIRYDCFMEFSGNEEFIKNHFVYHILEWKDEYFEYLNIKPHKFKYSYFKTYQEWKYKVIKSVNPLENIVLTNQQPKYPIYVVSYKRSKTPYTIDCLKTMKIDFKVCIKEEDEQDYLEILPSNQLLILYKHDELEENEKGDYNSIPQRNLCMMDSISLGYDKHWILDDNIERFAYRNKQKDTNFNYSDFFIQIENFSNNIVEEVGLISPNYTFDYGSSVFDRSPYNINCKNYSCILINNAVLQKYKICWRKKYNEDVRLTLDCLLNKVRTIGLNVLLIQKLSTGKLKGGNQDAYKNFTKEGFEDKLNELIQEYPEYITRTTERHKDGRPHHKIKYDKFKDFKYFTLINE